jgi:hypothetical protein
MFLVYGNQNLLRRLTGAGISAASLILVIGCASGSHSSTATPPPTPRQALLTAAIRAQQITTADETVSVRDTGVQDASLDAAVQVRLKPALEASENLTQTANGKTDRVKMILTGPAMYLSEHTIAAQFGKPWLKIELAALKGTPLAQLGKLVQDLRNNNVVGQARLLTVAKNARAVGRQMIDGVPTTEYAGSFTAAQALKELPAPLRSDLAPLLKPLGNSTIHFRDWIDDQHVTRHLVEVETLNGETINTTINVTAVNRPVTITPPPASQTAAMPTS